MLISTNSGIHGNRPDKPRYTMFESIDFCKAAGFDAIDINFFATTNTGLRKEWILEGDWRANIERLAKAIQDSGLFINSTHSPYCDIEFRSEEDRLKYDDCMRKSIEATGAIGAKYIVVHPCRDKLKDTLVEESVEYYLPYARYAQTFGVTLAIENMFSSTAAQLIRICEGLESKGVPCEVCWDTGHAHIKSKEQGGDIRALGKRIKVLHVHDNYGVIDNHNPPFFGNIDWQDVVEALRDIHYEGTFNYEPSFYTMPEGARMEIARYLVQVGRELVGKL